jgi:hypothetical protein
MGTAKVVVADIFADQVRELPLAHDDEVIQTFTADGADKPFGVSVEVGRRDHRGNTGDSVSRVVDGHQFRTVVMDQVTGFGVILFEGNELLLNKDLGGIPSHAPLNDLPGLQLHGEEHIPALSEGAIDREEVAGEQRVPVSLEERAPGSQGKLRRCSCRMRWMVERPRSMSSLASSPWILVRPKKRLDFLMDRIRSLIA